MRDLCLCVWWRWIEDKLGPTLLFKAAKYSMNILGSRSNFLDDVLSAVLVVAIEFPFVLVVVKFGIKFHD
jgi:hypothetical protein